MMNMTNKDATECIKANICYKQSCCNDGICKSTDDRPCAIDMAIEALEIAERLKQAITDEQTADCIIVDAECVNNKHDKEVWLNGYNQALADMRGDEE